jgi:3-hydroxyacyl-[acyl-carrier-protein] dehydratase
VIESATASGSMTLHFAANHPAAEGHFPGNPIIPGAVLLRDIIAVVRNATACDVSAVPSAKFHHVVRPGDGLVIEWVLKGDAKVRFSCSIAGTQQIAVTGELRLSTL